MQHIFGLRLSRLEAYASSRANSETSFVSMSIINVLDNANLVWNMNNYTTTFTQITKDAFICYLKQNPNKRRVNQDEKDNIVEWLTDPHKRPSTQQGFSRRNYVRKTFAWDGSTGILFAVAKKDTEKRRVVVTESNIADVVESVHNSNGHAGWDATWKDINSSYYGILRADVITLLKDCQVCLHNPRKRPKGSATIMPNIQLADEGHDFFEHHETFHLTIEPEYSHPTDA
ncbi:hypothetical protein PtrV1_04787 [Pyrenophora tritici-repentis]|nr:hypothetical protein PtrV1_04787 [Pyrenophora tritici-repentis]